MLALKLSCHCECSDPAAWPAAGPSYGVEQTVMLHAPGSFPMSAISPARVVCWLERAPRKSSSGEAAAVRAAAAARRSGCSEAGAAGTAAEGATALLWVHPAGYREALACLHACCKQHNISLTERCIIYISAQLSGATMPEPTSHYLINMVGTAGCRMYGAWSCVEPAATGWWLQPSPWQAALPCICLLLVTKTAQ